MRSRSSTVSMVIPSRLGVGVKKCRLQNDYKLIHKI